jgi:hypothetical protein
VYLLALVVGAWRCDLKRALILAAALALGSAATLSAAEVFGTISENGKPLPAGVVVKLDCGDASVSGKTDQFGSYTLRSSASGDCKLSVAYKGSAPSLKVTLYEKPAKYDLVVQEEAGKLKLARK